MALHRPRLRRAALPSQVLDGLEIGRGERVLAFAVDGITRGYAVATTWRLGTLTAGGEVAVVRPWYFVDAGVWQDSTGTLTVSWTDQARPLQWDLAADPGLLPETVRERVQASIVIAATVPFERQRSARVAIRTDLATGELIPQVVYGRGLRKDDPLVAAEIQLVLDDLSDQAGLPS